LELLGTGAEVRVTLKGQQVALRETVESFDDSVIRLRPGGTGEQRTVRYADVALLEFTKTKYRAEGSPDPVTVRRVAVELGVGRKVQVQTQDRNTLVGRIAKLDAEQLYLKIGEGGPVSVSYAQITELKVKRMSTLAKVGIGLGVAVGGIFVLAAAVCANGCN
jgi:ribosomal protein L19